MSTLVFKLRMAAVNARIRLMENALLGLIAHPAATQEGVLTLAGMLAQVYARRAEVENKFRSNAK